MEKCGSRRHSTTSFSENVEVAETSYEIYVRSFYHFLSGEGVTFSTKGKELHRFTSVPIGLQNHWILSKQASLLFSVSHVVNGTVNWILECRRT